MHIMCIIIPGGKWDRIAVQRGTEGGAGMIRIRTSLLGGAYSDEDSFDQTIYIDSVKAWHSTGDKILVRSYSFVSFTFFHFFVNARISAGF